MTNEEIYENVMGHKPNKEFGLKGSFSWDDINALMTAAKNCSIPDIVGRSELFKCPTCCDTKIKDNGDYCADCEDPPDCI